MLFSRVIIKQGFVELYTQRLIEGNIVRQKLSRLRPHRQKLHRLRPHRLTSHRLGLHRLSGSDWGGGGGGRGSSEIIYSSISRKKFHFCIIQTMLNKISKKKFWKKSWFSHFRKFSDLPQGGRWWYPPPPGGVRSDEEVILVIKCMKLSKSTRFKTIALDHH